MAAASSRSGPRQRTRGTSPRSCAGRSNTVLTRGPTMNSYSFVLLIRGADVLAEQHADALFEAGCADALFGERGGSQFADFDREADSFARAIGSAIHDIESAV